MSAKRFGPYVIQERLGAGGMGAVYAAEHELMGRRAAIKVLLPQYAANPDMIKRFVNEARSAAAVKHPGIVEIYDVNYGDGGVPYIAMELLDGHNLTQHLLPGELPRRAVFAVARQIASALAAAHQVGVVHRDLKPDNVFVLRDPAAAELRVKLLDFGVAKVIQPTADAQVTQTGVIVGTPSYMAPEQCRGIAVDHRADLYGLGCIVHRLVTGQPPFRGELAFDIITAHVQQPAPRLSARARDVPPALDALVARLLAKAPDDRPPSAAEVADAFARLEAADAAVVAAARALRTATPAPDLTLPTSRVVIADDAPTKQTRGLAQLLAMAAPPARTPPARSDELEQMPSLLLQPDDDALAPAPAAAGREPAAPRPEAVAVPGTMTLGSGAIASVEGPRPPRRRLAIVVAAAALATAAGVALLVGRPDRELSSVAASSGVAVDAGRSAVAVAPRADEGAPTAPTDAAAPTDGEEAVAYPPIDPEDIVLDSPRSKAKPSAGSAAPAPEVPAPVPAPADVVRADQLRAEAQVAHARKDYGAELRMLREAYRLDRRDHDLLLMGDAANLDQSPPLATQYYQNLIAAAPLSADAETARKRLDVLARRSHVSGDAAPAPSGGDQPLGPSTSPEPPAP